jgi:hypothetical protein
MLAVFPWLYLLGMSCLILPGGLDDSLEMFGTLGPGERRRVLTVLLEVSNQELRQFLFGTVHALRQCLPGENAEKAFDHVHPGSVRGGIVKVHSGMAQEPLFGSLVHERIRWSRRRVCVPTAGARLGSVERLNARFLVHTQHRAFSGGLRYSPTMSSSLASKYVPHERLRAVRMISLPHQIVRQWALVTPIVSSQAA